jgi:hypothetical protein
MIHRDDPSNRILSMGFPGGGSGRSGREGRLVLDLTQGCFGLSSKKHPNIMIFGRESRLGRYFPSQADAARLSSGSDQRPSINGSFAQSLGWAEKTSEYQPYTCGYYFHPPRPWTKHLISGQTRISRVLPAAGW